MVEMAQNVAFLVEMQESKPYCRLDETQRSVSLPTASDRAKIPISSVRIVTKRGI